MRRQKILVDWELLFACVAASPLATAAPAPASSTVPYVDA
jgi:hypothetical protein